MNKKTTDKDEVIEKVGDDVIKSNMQKNILIMLVFSVFIAIFALMNSEIVPVNLVFVELNLSAALVILISATIGAVIIYSFDAVVIYKLRKKIKALQAKIATDVHADDATNEQIIAPQNEADSEVEEETPETDIMTEDRNE